MRGVCDLEHIIWHCTFFSQVRRQHDSVLASIHPRDLNAAVLRGIAPAMRCRPGATFWGQAVAADATEEQVKLLGGGINDIPELILQEVELAWRSNLKCRQYMACKRGQFGGGVDLQFPKNITNEAPAEINVYGDGSMKNPADQAWSLSGFGVWWPEAVDDAQFRESLPSQNYTFEEVNREGIGQWNALHGQCGSSTRMEVAAWLVALTRGVAVHMGSDSQSLITKANAMLKTLQERQGDATKMSWPRPRKLRKPWSLQPDGDLWQQVWRAIAERGPHAQKLTKVKGYATSEDVVEERVRGRDKAGNDWADDLAERGAVRIGTEQGVLGTKRTASIEMASWVKMRHAAYCAFMFQVQTLIAKVLVAERAEREH